MSSVYIRNTIKNFLAANSSEKVVDFSGAFLEVPYLLEDNGVSHDQPWIGLDFIGSDETPIAINSGNTKGQYREFGAVYIHVVALAKLGSAGTILSRGEALRDLFRGQRLGDMLIESVAPLNFGSGSTLEFEGGYVSASFIVTYERDINL